MKKGGKKDVIETKLDRLASTVEKGFIAIAEDIVDLKEDMATKDDVREIVRDELRPTKEDIRLIREELRDIRSDLKDLKQTTRNMSGFSKEIDYALGRIVAIEKHLGIKSKATVSR